MTKKDKRGEFHRLLARAHHLHVKVASADLAKIGVTQGQPRLLHYLSENDGCIQKDICDRCDLEAATVTNILAAMEKAGAITRESDPEDRRVLRVYLTAKGRQTASRVLEIFATIEEECFRGFSERDRERTLEYLDRAYANMKALKDRKER